MISIESHYQFLIYTVVPSIIALQSILLVLAMILYHCRASGTYSRPAKSKSPKNIFKYTTGMYNYVYIVLVIMFTTIISLRVEV